MDFGFCIWILHLDMDLYTCGLPASAVANNKWVGEVWKRGGTGAHRVPSGEERHINWSCSCTKDTETMSNLSK